MSESVAELQTQYDALQQQIQSINQFLAGEENADVAQQALNLRSQQTQIQQQIATLNAKLSVIDTQIPTLANGKHKELLEAISQQRWYYFKDKTHVLYDSHTGYLWPNLDYFQMPTVQQGINADFELNGLAKGKWHPHTPVLVNNIASSYPSREKVKNTALFSSDYDYMSGYAGIFTVGGYNNSSKKDQIFFLPYCPLYANPDIAPHVTNFTPLEKAQKVLDLFLEQNWQPIFTNTEHYAIYQKLQQRPQLLQALNNLQPTLAQAIEHAKTQKQPLSSQFNHQTELQAYNLASIDASSLQYAHALQQWTHNLLNKLDDFSQQQRDLINTATTLQQRLHQDISLNENVGDDLHILAERDSYLQNTFNFGLDSVRSKLLHVQQQGLNLQQQLADTALSTTILSDLATIQHAPRPSFAFVAEYTTHIVITQITKLEWLAANSENIHTLLQAHHTWLHDFDTLTSKDYDSFLKAAKNERIEPALAQTWFNEWRQQRCILEQQLLPLYQLALHQQCPLTTANQVLDILHKHQQAINGFYKKERLATHQRHAFSPNGAQQEQYDTQLQLFKLSSTFQEQLEKCLFELPQMAARISLLRWGEVITQQHLSHISQQTNTLLANHQHSDIWQTINQELRTLQQSTLEAFIQDAAHFGKARQQRDLCTRQFF